jgi:phage baseplate assembly protein V
MLHIKFRSEQHNMTNRLTNAIKSHAAILDRSAGQIKFGTITSVNSSNATARVLIQPEGVLSGWLPVVSQWVGNGWGLACPPLPGQQVIVAPQEGDIEQGMIVGRLFSIKDVPPAAPGGELWIVHQSGSFLKLCNDGTIRIKGDLHVEGDIYDSQGSLSRLRTHYDAHTHTLRNNQTTNQPTPTD